uniref:WSC domain-containing protein n=1 Tax=Macrostomum lignano TaxID=282301 RepID=A0A1I8G9H2_9PLAT
ALVYKAVTKEFSTPSEKTKMSPFVHRPAVLAAACCSLLLVIGVTAARVSQVSYIGCFKDNSARDMRGLSGIKSVGEISVSEPRVISGSMTQDFCSGFCALGGFPYFGLQNAWACFCSWDFGSIGPAKESDCNMPCNGNSSQTCGGPWRNSVFALTYPKRSCFKQLQMPSLNVSSTVPTSWSIAAQTALDCLIPCEASADCQAVIFSGQQRLCHLL